MATKIGENTNITLDLKTIGMIIGFTVTIASMYFVMQADIAEAKELPKPEISKLEYESVSYTHLTLPTIYSV